MSKLSSEKIFRDRNRIKNNEQYYENLNFKEPKKCSKCFAIKTYYDFNRNKSTLDGFNFQCKSCAAESNKRDRVLHKEARLQTGYRWLDKNREQVNNRNRIRYHETPGVKEKNNADSKLFREAHPEYFQEKGREYREEHPEYFKDKMQEFQEKNPEYFKDYSRINGKIRYHDPEDTYKVKVTLRNRLNGLLKKSGATKTISALKLLGCTIDEFWIRMEATFHDCIKTGEVMTRENHGKKGWHIDHIRPCASFDLTDVEEQKKCFHYTNLQALWWWENLAKGDKVK
jgi:hypothetical protein